MVTIELEDISHSSEACTLNEHEISIGNNNGSVVFSCHYCNESYSYEQRAEFSPSEQVVYKLYHLHQFLETNCPHMFESIEQEIMDTVVSRYAGLEQRGAVKTFIEEEIRMMFDISATVKYDNEPSVTFKYV